MTATRRPRSETQAETRQHLLDAAERLFAEHGFHGTSVAQIAKAAGYTTGAIYANFERKEDLALAVLDRNDAQGEAAVAIALAVDGDLAARLLSIIQWLKARPDEDPAGILRIELWLLARRDPRLRADLLARQNQQQDASARLLDEQVADLGGTYRVDTDVLAAALRAAGDGASLADALDPAGRHLESYVWTLATLLLNAMEPQPIDSADLPEFMHTLLRAAAES